MYVLKSLLLVFFVLIELHRADFCEAPREKRYLQDASGTREFSLMKSKINKETKLCRYRDEGLFPNPVWRWRTGGGCYCYFSPDWFSKKIQMLWSSLVINGEKYVFPIGKINKTYVTFDYADDNYVKMIQTSFKDNNYFQKWYSCAYNADICCNSTMNKENIYPNEEYPCPAVWDAWSCFNSAINNSTVEVACPEYTTSSDDFPCTLYSKKQCLNGLWNQQTDYSTCASAPVYRRRHNFHIIIMYISIVLSFPAVIIFTAYKNLRILRVNLHRNLLIACILRNIFTILTKELIILDSLKPPNESNNVLNENGVPCRILAYFNNVAANAIYACMLMDGFYLHKLIVRIFSSEPNIYIMYIVVAALSFLPSTIWAIFLTFQANEHCWMVDTAWYQWIPDGFRIAILSVNIILLLDIIRALLSKLKKNTSAQHTKSTLKAMSFLIPLFGVPFLLTADRGIVKSNSCVALDAYYYSSYLIQGLQGVMVAVLFCYWNKEVHVQIKGTYARMLLLYEERFGSKNESRSSIDRRETAATYVHNNSVIPKPDFPLTATENTSNRISDWINESTKSVKNDYKVEFCAVDPENYNSVENNRTFNRVSKFIDDSSESIKK